MITGDSPIAAYDQETRQVLIMDVDREWYVPYWTTDTKLLEAMLRRAPPSMARSPERRAVWSGLGRHHRDQ